MCLCPQCGEKFSAYTSEPKVCAADAKVGENVEERVRAKLRKNLRKLLWIAGLAGLILIVCVVSAFVRKSRGPGMWHWDPSWDPNNPQTPQQQSARDLNLAMIHLTDAMLTWTYYLQTQDRGLSAELVARFVADLEKVEVRACPDDMRNARAAVIVSLRQFGADQTASAGVASVLESVSKGATLYRLWDQLKPKLDTYSEVLSRYGVNVKFDSAMLQSLLQSSTP